MYETRMKNLRNESNNSMTAKRMTTAQDSPAIQTQVVRHSRIAPNLAKRALTSPARLTVHGFVEDVRDITEELDEQIEQFDDCETNRNSPKGTITSHTNTSRPSTQLTQKLPIADQHNKILKPTTANRQKPPSSKNTRIPEIQKERLVQLVLNDFSKIVGRFAGSDGAHIKTDLWNKIANQLNTLGPPRTAKQWKATFDSIKASAKVKLADIHNKPEGRNKHVLTRLEEKIVSTYGMDLIDGYQIVGQSGFNYQKTIPATRRIEIQSNELLKEGSNVIEKNSTYEQSALNEDVQENRNSNPVERSDDIGSSGGALRNSSLSTCERSFETNRNISRGGTRINAARNYGAPPRRNVRRENETNINHFFNDEEDDDENNSRNVPACKKTRDRSELKNVVFILFVSNLASSVYPPLARIVLFVVKYNDTFIQIIEDVQRNHSEMMYLINRNHLEMIGLYNSTLKAL
ncbi:hypothetical protein Bhyg_12367, partial [Pseudolycoriella hygida]